MLIIKFYPDSNIKDFSEAVGKYRDIWKKKGREIVKSIEKVSGLKFKETYINSIVFQAKFPSQSYPLCLRADLPDDRKTSILIHELTHRILAGNGIGPLTKQFKNEKEKSFGVHQILYLILYDIWVDLYNEKFAQESALAESNIPRTDVYKKAWKWALSFSFQERQKKFSSLVKSI